MLHQGHQKAVAARLDARGVAAERVPRRRGLALRQALARFCPPATIELGPGERMIGGRVFYSATWLNPSPLARPPHGNEHPRLEGVIVARGSRRAAGDAGSRRRAGRPAAVDGQRQRRARRPDRAIPRASPEENVVAVDRKQRAELGRLLAAAGGYRVRTADGKDVGHVDHVRYLEHADHPDQIAVRRRWLWQRPLLLSIETVAAVDPRAHTISLRPTSPDGNRSSKRSTVLSSGRLLPHGLEVEMFKRRKSAEGVGRPAKIGSLVAALGGLLGGLLFWRKRKAS